MPKSPRLRVLLIVLGFFAFLTVLVWQLQNRYGRQNLLFDVRRTATPALQQPPVPNSNSPENSRTHSTPTLEPSSIPSPTATASVETSPSPLSYVGRLSYVGQLKLIVPVAGVSANQLQDTFADARSEERVHDAIDIPAPPGTPVIAAADGEILKLFQSDRGGTTIYQLSSDRKLIFYYAHLQRYADGIVEGKRVRQGEVIGFVGDTGNAGVGNYHLHFSIAITADPKRYWEGTNINPYPLLKE